MPMNIEILIVVKYQINVKVIHFCSEIDVLLKQLFVFQL